MLACFSNDHCPKKQDPLKIQRIGHESHSGSPKGRLNFFIMIVRGVKVKNLMGDRPFRVLFIVPM